MTIHSPEEDVPPVTSKYVPGAHSIQSDAESIPSVDEYLPTEQSPHELDSLLLLSPSGHPNPYLPTGHSLHTDPPGESRYVPTGHSIQSVEATPPVTFKYLPTGHDIHWGSVEPRYLPISQEVQLVDPTDAVYLPLGQFAQFELLGPL